MKECYINPLVEILSCDEEDILTVSGEDEGNSYHLSVNDL